MMAIVKRNGDVLEVTQCDQSLDAKLIVFGEAVVELEGERIIVVKDEAGNLVEKNSVA